jgi:hypothetical protein
MSSYQQGWETIWVG